MGFTSSGQEVRYQGGDAQIICGTLIPPDPLARIVIGTRNGGVNIPGELSIASNFLAGSLLINGPATTVRVLRFASGTVNRWQIVANATAEGGADAGSDLEIRAYTDAGVLIDAPVSVTRAAGLPIVLARKLTFTADNTKDIGSTGAARPRTIYVGTSIVLQADNALVMSAQVDKAAAGAGTLLNAPQAGNPTWIGLNRNGVSGAIPWWPL